MSGSSRPSMQSVQRSLIVGILVGVILGCVVGAGVVGLYIRQNPPVYAGGAYPRELTDNYQGHYLAMVIDSYLVNRQVDVAQDRLQTFDTATKIRALGRWSATYVAGGRAAEAQAINQLAVALSQVENWSPEVISQAAGELATEFEGDPTRSQAVTNFASQLGQVPLPSAGQPETPPAAAEPVESPEPAAAPSGGVLPVSTTTLLLCCLGLILIALIVFVLYRRLAGQQQAPKPEIVWEGEGPAPIKQWTGTYTLGQDTYDEFFTIETLDGDFLGESGVGILEAIPGTSPKQVVAFDVGLFDKTDITTLSRVLMSEHAYNDPDMSAKVEANPQAEAILAEPGKTFTLETSALRVEATIDDMEYGEGGNAYFDKLTISLNVFIREGADLKIGTMDVPDEYKA